MSEQKSEFSWYDPLQQLANHLDFTITHAIHIHYNKPLFARNSYHQSRLIFIENVEGTDGGAIRLCENGVPARDFILRPQTLLFFPPNLDLIFDYKPGLTCLGIHFNLSLVPGVDIFEKQISPKVIPFTDTSTLKKLREATWHKDSLKDLLWCKGALLSIAASFIEGDIEQHLEAMRFGQKYASLLSSIEANPRMDFEIGAAAHLLNLAPGTLSRNFKKDSGISLHEWVIKRVLRKALRVLSESDQSIKFIATELGFSSAVYFSRFIKKHTGKAPGDFRKTDED
ncbi:MAG: helix-turn-helix domain-containing protein [Puniceicoccales bacterium]|jgi:AraC family transcriptional activator of pobA|nr:helix-turn-helix domain-containing protein [Puniceicoccales bacterium]